MIQKSLRVIYHWEYLRSRLRRAQLFADLNKYAKSASLVDEEAF
jgi:hypothetical protein